MDNYIQEQFGQDLMDTLSEVMLQQPEDPIANILSSLKCKWTEIDKREETKELIEENLTEQEANQSIRKKLSETVTILPTVIEEKENEIM
ncbi:MAG: hypothetical protein MHPSP_003212 [Paramarteilia canceri]